VLSLIAFTVSCNDGDDDDDDDDNNNNDAILIVISVFNGKVCVLTSNVQSVPFILSPTTAALSHTTPASAGTCRDGCRILRRHKWGSIAVSSAGASASNFVCRIDILLMGMAQ
jgi:hypothetical protein